MKKTTLTLSPDLRDQIMFIKIQCKAKSCEVVVNDAIRLLKYKLKEDSGVAKNHPQDLPIIDEVRE